MGLFFLSHPCKQRYGDALFTPGFSYRAARKIEIL